MGGATRTGEGLLVQLEQGLAHPYVLEVAGDLVGRVTLTEVSRGLFCGANFGWWAAAERAGRGVATSA